MAVVLLVLGCIAFLAGLAVFAHARGAIHEIEALVLVLIAAVLVAGGATVDAVGTVAKRLRARPRKGEEDDEWSS